MNKRIHEGGDGKISSREPSVMGQLNRKHNQGIIPVRFPVGNPVQPESWRERK
jgi:hypothetical protein